MASIEDFHASDGEAFDLSKVRPRYSYWQRMEGGSSF